MSKQGSKVSYDKLTADEAAYEPEKQTVERTITFFSGAMMCVGMMIGSGIFSLPAIILGLVGSVGATILCFICGGMIAMAGAWAYSELGCMRPVSGGEKEYLDYAYPKLRGVLSFMFTQTCVFLVRPGAAAAVSVAFGQYIMYALVGRKEMLKQNGYDYLEDSYEWLARGLGVFCIVFTTCVHGLAPKWGIAIQNALSLMKIAMLMLVLVTGIIAATGLTSMPRANNYANTFTGTTTDANAYATALLNAFFTFDGWNNLNYSLDELIDPIKNLPRASMSAVAITGTLYTTAVISYFLVIPIDQIDTKTAILGGQFFTMTMGETVGQRIIPVLIGLSSFGSVMCTSFGASRITRSAALEGYFPCAGFFGKLNKQGAPIGGLILHLCVTLVLMLGPPPGEIYKFLINLAAYPAYIFYGLTVVGLLVLRKTEPDTPRPFKSYWIPNLLFVAMCVFLTFFPFVPPAGPYDSPIPYYLHALIGISWLVLCMPWWYLQVIIFGGKKKATEKKIDDSILAGSGSPKKSNTDHVMDVVHSYSPTLFSEDDSKLAF